MKNGISTSKIFPLLLVFAIPFTCLGSGEAGIGSMSMTHRMMMLAMQLGVILFAARVGNVVAMRIGLPGVLGELGAGVVIGPFMLGQIPLPGFESGVFPIFSSSFPVSPELYGLCAVASVILLFMVGLETDLPLFLRYSVAGSVVGVSGVAFSFLAGCVSGWALLPPIFGTKVEMLSPACIFLGIMSTATSVGISSRILSEKRKLDTPEGVTILAGSVIDDVLGIIMLALGIGIVETSGSSGSIDWNDIISIGLKAVAIWLAATVLGIVAANKISLLLKLFKHRSHIALMSLGLALIMAALFEEARLAMIIGAYVTGLSLSKTDIRNVIRENLHHSYEFLVPVFFAVMGMLVDVRLLLSPKVLLFGLIYSAACVLSKVFGCGLPSMACNFNFRGAMRIGAGMLPRGEVALIIAGVGLASGILSMEIFAIGILMTIATTVSAAPLIVALFNNPAPGVRKQPATLPPTEKNFIFPSVEIASILNEKLCMAFEHEGFFVHSLSRENKVFQLLKDDMAIGLRQTECTISFECGEKETHFIGTAMIEVVAEFERIVKELKRPIDIRKITENIPKSSKKPAKSTLSGFLIREAMIPRLEATNKTDAIKELLRSLDRQDAIDDYTSAENAVFDREASMSTGMEFGVAIPHGRTDAVSKLVATIGLKPEGIEFESMDGRPATIIVLALSPTSTAAPHMQFMAMMSNALDDTGRQAILKCSSKSDMMEVLSR
ncbi:MAG: cation:proton antiporter [Victivallales bacterium]|nr:cation:proton antiporter [Victivallales bacterium]